MNKKHLSVVMAGAMLATSVAPVLAEVVKEEKSANELGLLQKEMRELINSKVFANDDSNAALRGKSVYEIYVNGVRMNLDVNSTQDDWQAVFNNINAGDVVKVYSKGFRENNGKYYSTELPKTEKETYKAEELPAIAEQINKKVFDPTMTGGDYVTSVDGSVNGPFRNLVKKDGAKIDPEGNLVIEFVDDLGINGTTPLANTLVIKVGSNKVDVLKYIDSEGVVRYINKDTTPGKFFGFPEKPAVQVAEQDIKSSLEKEITITAGGHDLTVEELYDGLMLTEKGHDFFDLIKEAKSMGREITINGNNTSNPIIKTASNSYEGNVEAAIKMLNGKARFSITFGKKGKLAAETYVITGLNEKNTERLAKWMIKPLARVDILAGDNRYETAAKIAKEYAGLTGNNVKSKYTNLETNLVLVNGNALVDGLSAAPLAATKTNEVYDFSKNTWKNESAPILLTEADGLPRATKVYLKEVLKNVEIGKLGKVTIHLVGGESVLNKSLERELKGLGFSVERYGGANREETSIEVMKEIDSKSKNRPFVVGANGEADAMSIAAVAAETKTPIVVAKNGGISEDATYELRGKEVTIIGGEVAVSKADYNAIKEEAKAVQRIAGSNRKETNAQIIEKYYRDGFLPMHNVIVAKDGQHNKMELIDALAAANMAAAKDAPIVLATDKLTKSQENILELKGKDSQALYQVGHGVARDVVKTIAENLGLTNR